MAQASQLSPDLARGLLQLARAMVGAARHWALYPPERSSRSRTSTIRRRRARFIWCFGRPPVSSGGSSVETLVADRDPRVVPMLARIVAESHPLGADHDVVLETLTALGVIGTDESVPVLADSIRRHAFLRRRKLRALKERGVAALRRIGTPKATIAVEEGARTGDRMLRKVIAFRQQT